MIYVVSSDPAVQSFAISSLITQGREVLQFESAASFVAHSARPTDVPSCLLLDAELPDMCSLELQQRIAAAAHPPPIVFIGGSSDVRYAVCAVKAGAHEFLTKPLDPVRLVEAVESALEEDTQRRRQAMEVEALRQRVAQLTPREMQVLPLLVAGLRNKQVAWELGVSEATIQVHRGQIMRKMLARSFADLVRMVVLFGLIEN